MEKSNISGVSLPPFLLAKTKNDTFIPWSSWWKFCMWHAVTERVKQKWKREGGKKETKQNHSKVAKNLKRWLLRSLVSVF